MSEQIVRHIQQFPCRASFKLTRSTQGVSLEIDVTPEKLPTQSEREYVDYGAELMRLAYAAALREVELLGLTVGPNPKPEARS